jgi:hypothetical protein
MVEAKTKLTGASADDFLDRIENDLDQQRELLKKLWAHSCGKGCLYIKRLSDVHLPTLTTLVNSSVGYARKSQPS